VETEYVSNMLTQLEPVPKSKLTVKKSYLVKVLN